MPRKIKEKLRLQKNPGCPNTLGLTIRQHFDKRGDLGTKSIAKKDAQRDYIAFCSFAAQLFHSPEGKARNSSADKSAHTA